MKRFASLLLALAMVFAMSTTAFAATGTNSNDGKITIDNAVVGQTYTIYQILKLESYDTEKGTYAYKVVDTNWKAFLTTGAGKDYVTVDGSGYVTWKGAAETKDADAAAFAKAALAYAKTNSIAATASKTATTTTVEFEKLNLGYYLVDSTLGTLCSLDTTNPTVTIKEKNSLPTSDKQVQEDSNSNWGSENDADIKQDVSFKIKVTVPVGTENLTVHDKMSSGLTLKAEPIKVYTDAALTTELTASYYTVKTTDLTDGCTFEVAFTKTYLDSLTAAATLYVGYTATLNENAVVGLPGNPNESKLSYGDSSNIQTTTPSTTKTYTWDMDVLKYANGVESDVLAGVKFVLLNKDKSKVATVDANGKLTGWEAVPAAVDGVITWSTASVLTTNADGKIEIDGLDADTYYLREIEALPGFNVLNEDKQFEIKGKELKDGQTAYETILIKVENKSGAELPSTGGMGTTLFYVLGGALVIGAAVLLVVKRRMNGAER